MCKMVERGMAVYAAVPLIYYNRYGERMDEQYMDIACEYGGKHFIPVAKLGKIKSISDIKLRSDFELGFIDDDYYGRRMFTYSHEGFYKAMKDSEMDIFVCVENGKLYIPCEHELFIYEGMRSNKNP